MKFEPVDLSTANKLYKPTKLQTILDEFMAKDDLAVRCILAPGEYKNPRSAQSSFATAIKKLRHPVAARILNGELYLIKINL